MNCAQNAQPIIRVERSNHVQYQEIPQSQSMFVTVIQTKNWMLHLVHAEVKLCGCYEV